MTMAYPFIMIVALAAGALLSRMSQQSLELSGREKLGIGLGAFLGAMLGAKLPFVLSDWNGLLSGMAWFSSGKTILCGLVGGYFGVELAKWILEVRVKTGDSFAVPVAVSVAIGRLACFSAGCCYGTPTQLPWGVVFSDCRCPAASSDATLRIGLSLHDGRGAVAVAKAWAAARPVDQALYHQLSCLPLFQ